MNNRERPGGSGGSGPGGAGGGRSHQGGRNFRPRYRHGQKWGRRGSQNSGRPGGGESRAPRVVSEAEKVFIDKTPVDPHQWIQLEKGSSDLTMRAMDLLCPIGRGTRGLIVAPPKAGKTTILKSLSNAVYAVDPNIKQYCLLVDERPEEVTDFKRSVKAEVSASSSDRSYQEHVATAEALMAKAITDAAAGLDVLILLDSLTRLARVHNQFAGGTRTMSGGLDSRAMEVPRRFFGAARKLEEGGSLTIIATILVDTGSKMDDIIFQEFKGTGNMEIVLSRSAAEMRLFPAMKVRDSGTRKEEKIFPPEVLEGVWKLRRLLADKGDTEALKLLLEMMRTHKTNHALLGALK